MKKQGIVVKWDSEKSFGFIRSPDTPTDIFFHRRDYSENRSPVEGLAVTFQETQDRRTRDVAAQAFEFLALVRLGGDSRMQGESADRAGAAFGRIRIGLDRLQRRHLAPGLRAGGDAVGDRTHPQRVQAVAAASAVGQEGGFVFAFGPALARQMPAHPVRARAPARWAGGERVWRDSSMIAGGFTLVRRPDGVA